MFGKLLGAVLSAPVRLVNVPIQVIDDVCDPVKRPLKERDPAKLDEIADLIQEACEGHA
jgi:hypothetical protein